MARTRDAEAELNLPPGFRFHPTDEELVADYLVRRATGRRLPVPIIAEIDLYKFNPWDLPEMALFGKREWYFFTPRDRKYQNGSRPNRTAGSGYWKATGADKPVPPPGAGRPLGIKKALVFYSGKAPKGVKTDWIMHEYRLADVDRSAVNKKGSLRLDDCVLCRLYNKKNKWEKQQPKKQVASVAQSSPATASFESNNGSTWSADSLWTTDSDVEHDALGEITGDTNWREVNPAPLSQELQMVEAVKEESQWFLDIDLEDFQSTLAAIESGQKTDESNQNYYDSGDWKQNQYTCLQSFWN